ncbi:hypothetical protein PIB30_084750 [Stylosanthes scabra]|uniref:Uncharacterized protein n=1 Tax=Stylosanthes scabra TaxID=79078 RepID=A0ABU6VTP5_9FABA|nr:hypothetical protein [Stylosanthes scabra]
MLKGHKGAAFAARFNTDGNYCLNCSKDRTIRLWNPHRNIHIKTYKSHGRDVHVTSDNSKLCSCGRDRHIFYWDVATSRVIRKFRGHDSENHPPTTSKEAKIQKRRGRVEGSWRMASQNSRSSRTTRRGGESAQSGRMVLCEHGVPAVKRISGTKENPGRPFWGCVYYKVGWEVTFILSWLIVCVFFLLPLRHVFLVIFVVRCRNIVSSSDGSMRSKWKRTQRSQG